MPDPAGLGQGQTFVGATAVSMLVLWMRGHFFTRLEVLAVSLFAFGATLFSTLEPCTMCCGAVIQARLARVDQFVQARKEQTLRQVGGLVRRVDQACRDCANEGAKLLKEKLSLWRTWKILWSRGRG